jgi:penicillin-binding protein 1A
LAIALVATACSVEPIEDPGIGAGSLTSTVYAADGTVLTEWHAGEDRVLVVYGELPHHLVDAVVAIEDQRFWVHSGVDARAVARAVQVNLEAGEVVQGGSTITQQYVKNVMLSGEVTLDRKVEEASLAMGLEETLTKEEILERYLNTVYFGNGAYGIGAAAKRYFGKPPSELDLAESALLAGIIRNPNTLDPYQDPDAVRVRRQMVLDKMVDLGWLDRAAADTAGAAALILQPRGAADRSLAPYFVDEVRRLLLAEPSLGDTPEERFELLSSGGLRIYTTLDPVSQHAAEIAVASVLPEDGPSAALVAIDPRNGHVRALVGGRDFYDPDDPVAQFNLATMGLRQPGSAFKPFTLAAALEAGFALDGELEGGRSITLELDGEDWRVNNYNNLKFPNLSLLEATVFSVNVVYAQLIDAVGAERVAEIAAATGITTSLDPVPSLALGTQEVTVLDMASAYSTFAAGGLHVDPVFVTRVDGPDGRILYEPVPTVEHVIDGGVAADVTAALTAVVRRGTGQQAKIGRPVAGKTGTTEGHHDAWFVGYTPQLSTAVWVGFAEGNRALVSPNTPYTITGGTWPAQIWSRFAAGALSGIPYRELPSADHGDVIAAEIDLSTGFLAGPLCPRSDVAVVHVHEDEAPTVPCPIHNPPGLRDVTSGIVPEVVGWDLADAVALLEAAGYEVTASWIAASSKPGGTVIFQRPAATSELPAGSEVAISVSGPEPGTTVPNVVGLPQRAAVELLLDLGFVVEVTVAREPDPDAPDLGPGVVWDQYPTPGNGTDGPIQIQANP